jgi:hypothetical protein
MTLLDYSLSQMGISELLGNETLQALLYPSLNVACDVIIRVLVLLGS